MAFPDAAQLEQLLAPLVGGKGFDVEHVKTTKAGKKSQVVIRIDGDTRPSSDDLESLSQEIGAFFDAAEERGELNFGAGYTLEVSTPGVDLPLRLPRHYRRNRGRLVAFELDDAPGTKHTARIGAMSPAEDAVVLVTSRKKELDIAVVELAKIGSAVVEIEFAKPPQAEVEAAQLEFEEAAAQAGRED